MSSSKSRADERAVLSTEWQVELTGANSAAARWVVGTEDVLPLGAAEDALNAPGTKAGTAPDKDVAAWVAESLSVTGVELAEAGNGRWSVGITD